MFKLTQTPHFHSCTSLEFLCVHAKFGAAKFHGFGVMNETDGLTDGLAGLGPQGPEFETLLVIEVTPGGVD